MAETDWRLQAEDLNRLAIACPHCGTEQVFQAVSTEDLVKEIVCQNCEQPLKGVKALIVSYRAFFGEVQRASHAVFVVRKPSD